MGNKAKIGVYFVKEIARDNFLKNFRVDPLHFYWLT